MKPNFRTCPQCSTRNRLDKEFCVKCGEPLEGVQAGDPAAKAPGAKAAAGGKKSKIGIVISDDREETQSALVPFVLVLLILGVAFGAWQQIQTAEATTNVPANTAPRVQPSLPPAAAATMAPGVKEYTAGMAALRASDYENALRLLREAVTAAGDKADYRLGLAEALEKSGATADALAAYQVAASLDSTNFRYTSEWAKALNRAGRSAEAVEAYLAALQIDPDNLANLKELAALHMKADNFAGARPYLERVVGLQPNDLAPKQNLARALEAARDLEGAAKQYRDILADMPEANLTRALLSDVLMRQNRPSDALALLDEGLRLDAAAGVLHREKGRVFDRLGRTAEAVASYREYVRLSPGANDIRSFTERISQLSAPQ
jgi:tetratricopeptide (TPR) repeat protein